MDQTSNKPAFDSPASGIQNWSFGFATIDRLADIAVAACHHESQQRRQLVSAILKDLIQNSGISRILLAYATPLDDWTGNQTAPSGHRHSTDRDNESIGVPHASIDQPTENVPETGCIKPLAGAVIVLSNDRSANLLAVGTVLDQAQSENRRLVRELVDFVHQHLAARSIDFVQAMRQVDDPAELLEQCGYEKLASLDYLYADVYSPKQRSSTNNIVKWTNFHDLSTQLGSTERAERLLLNIVDRTYEKSMDCPAIGAIRDTAMVIEGYRSAAAYDPKLWLLCSDSSEGCDSEAHIGCLLLTKHPAGGSIEITYMGVEPRRRGSGLGTVLLERANDEAFSLGYPQLTLAVDRANSPALNVYHRFGFQPLISEAVWGRKIAV